MINNDDCCEINSNPRIVVSEKGKRFCIENPQRRPVQVCRVDGCLIGEGVKKCDFLFVLDCDDVRRVVLVELKGVDHIKAVEQLVSSAEQLNLKSKAVEIATFIVGSASPKTTTLYQKELVKMSSRYRTANVCLPIRKNDQHSITWP